MKTKEEIENYLQDLHNQMKDIQEFMHINNVSFEDRFICPYTLERSEIHTFQDSFIHLRGQIYSLQWILFSEL